MADGNVMQNMVASEYGWTLTREGESITLRTENESVKDALSRKTEQLESLLSTLLIESGGNSTSGTEIDSKSFHSLLWLAWDVSREAKLLTAVL